MLVVVEFGMDVVVELGEGAVVGTSVVIPLVVGVVTGAVLP